MTVPLADRRPHGRVDEIEVALVGRPNSGKTSLLMHLTATAQKPVNFPGTSVERVESCVDVEGRRLRIVDLPGVSSLHPLSRDEEVALGYLRLAGPRPHVICAVLDASKISVELRLLQGLLRLGRPIVVALNKSDVALAEGVRVNAAALAEILQLPVIETDGMHGKGIQTLRQVLVAAPDRGPARPLEEHADTITARVQSSSPRRTSLTDRLDAILLHRTFGLPLLLVLMFGMFQLVYSGAEPFVSWIELGQEAAVQFVSARLPAGALQSFVVDGLICGLGSILVFLPQIALLIALVALLEGSGYMARAAVLLDRVLSRVGLSGRSFVPLTASFACAIPGILASRIIADERDRIATIVVSPLMSCSARLPVYVLLIGAFFPVAWAGVVLFGLYLLGIVTAAAVAWLLRRTVLRGGASPLLLELPVYQLPSLRVVWSQVRSACREFAVLAGTIILATAIVIWFLSYYPRPLEIHERFATERARVGALPESERSAALDRLDLDERRVYLEQSLLARGGKLVQPLLEPAGFDWRISVGVLSAFPARELIVPTLGILFSAGQVDPGKYGVGELASADSEPDGLRQRLRTATRPDGTPVFTAAIALALMVFFSLCSQCASTLGAIRRETHSWRWPLFTFAYMTGVAWIAAVLVYQLATRIGLGG